MAASSASDKAESPRRPAHTDDKGVVDLAGDAMQDIATLLQTELQLLRAEISEKLTFTALSAALIGLLAFIRRVEQGSLLSGLFVGLEAGRKASPDRVLVQSLDLLSAQGDGRVTPAEGDVWMVAFGLGELTDFLNKGERFLEIAELKHALDAVGIISQIPVGSLCLQALGFITREWWNAATTRRACPLGEHHLGPVLVLKPVIKATMRRYLRSMPISSDPMMAERRAHDSRSPSLVNGQMRVPGAH